MRWGLLVIAFPLVLGVAAAAASDGQRADSAGQKTTADLVLLPEPAVPLYAPYLADPRRPNFSFQWMRFGDSEIADSGKRRYGVKFGGSLELARARPAAADRGWQFVLEGGFIAQFDQTRDADAIGWDGLYGVMAAWRPSAALAWKLGLRHVSAHVGDEYAERTGRRRIEYTRGEVVAGARVSASDRWRAYAEAGWAYDLRNDLLQQPWRAQLGVEYVRPWRAAADWYAALDLHASEERDWRVDRTWQAGLALRRGARTWRFGIEHYRGRSLLGEFFQDDERYTSLAVWLDL